MLEQLGHLVEMITVGVKNVNLGLIGRVTLFQ